MATSTFEREFLLRIWIHCKGLLLDVKYWFDTL